MEPDDPDLIQLVAKLGRAAAANAIKLAEEAELLDDNGHRARAFALTVLAAEELGKAFICRSTSARARELDDWTIYRDMVLGPKKHELKLFSALFVIQKLPGIAGLPVGELARQLEDLVAGDLAAAKMRALYVDVEGGEVATPDRVADHEGAQQRARALRSEVISWAIPLSLEPLEGAG